MRTKCSTLEFAGVQRKVKINLESQFGNLESFY